jgi:hypothetical protein
MNGALWYGGTVAQEIQDEKVGQKQKKSRSNLKINKILNELA